MKVLFIVGGARRRRIKFYSSSALRSEIEKAFLVRLTLLLSKCLKEPRRYFGGILGTVELNINRQNKA
jgi:hypothetical protein